MATAEQVKVDTKAAALLARLALAELVRWSLENADVRRRLHRHRPSRRDRALKVGAVALGFAVAALVASRVRREGDSLTDAAPPVA
jgi:hypothetical protein